MGLFTFALLSFKRWFSAANSTSYHMCEGMEGWRRGRVASDDSAPPLRLQNVSNYLHLPPTNFCKPSRAFLSPYPPRCKNHPNPTLSHLSCEPPRLDDPHPFPPPGFVTLQLIRTEMRLEKNRKREKRRCRKEWWNLRCFSCNDVSHLCVQKVIYSEWSSGLRDLGGTRFHQVGPRGEAMGLLMYSALTFMESNLARIYSNTETDGCENTHILYEHLVAHMRTSPPRQEYVYT